MTKMTKISNQISLYTKPNQSTKIGVRTLGVKDQSNQKLAKANFRLPFGVAILLVCQM